MPKAQTLAIPTALGFLANVVGCSPTADEAVGQSPTELRSRAPDATARGPLETTSSEYRLPAGVDPDVLGDRATEIWARVYRPASLGTADKHPLLVFLHGNHGTCGRGSHPRIDDSTQYTQLGTCPENYVVTPNHLGYGYIADRLASWGYVVVSINANRGITAGDDVDGDPGLNRARGRLVLKHLQLLSEWNATSGASPSSLGVDLAGTIDFENVGLMGHSRGGEGVRAAYNLYRDAGSPWPARIKTPVVVKAITEIGPIDTESDHPLSALGTAWNVLLPMCDGEVSDLQGMRPFDRMLAATSEPRATPKAMFAVWGANHNFYNTEWQQSDARSCRGDNQRPLFQPGATGSEQQQTTGLYAVMGWFRAHVGRNADASFNDAFDPLHSVPEALATLTTVERAYVDAADASHAVVLEDFSKGTGTSLVGGRMLSSGVQLKHEELYEHDPALRTASIKWTTTGASTYLQIPFAAAGSGVDASQMTTFDFRVSRHVESPPTGPIDFSIQLVNVDGTFSRALKLREYLDLPSDSGHELLATARIPLGDFSGATLNKVRGVRLVFDGTGPGGIHLANVRFSRSATPVHR